MRTLLEWLAESPPGPLPFKHREPWLPEKPTRFHIYAALVGINGSARVSGWGTQVTGGPYGRHGLTKDEALALIALGSFVEGWLEATGGGEYPELKRLVDLEWERVGKETEKWKLL